MTSSRVACAPTFRGVRGPLALGGLGVGVAKSEEVWGALALVSVSAKIISVSTRTIGH